MVLNVHVMGNSNASHHCSNWAQYAKLLRNAMRDLLQIYEISPEKLRKTSGMSGPDLWLIIRNGLNLSIAVHSSLRLRDCNFELCITAS